MSVLVVGSINMDISVFVDEFANIGETIKSNKLEYFPGGKGANQAVAAARFGSDVSFLGKVGGDEFGKMLITNLLNNQVDCNLVEVVSGSSGVAVITVSATDNIVIVNSGANDLVDEAFIVKHQDYITSFDYIIIQNEIPMSSVLAIINLCSNTNAKVVYNPAPAVVINKDLIAKCYLVTPNKHEYKYLEGCQDLGVEAAVQLYDNLLITLGSDGCVTQVASKVTYFDTKAVKVLDTTGAGDCFNGCLVSLLDQGYELSVAISYALQAATTAVTCIGAQSCMPTFAKVKGDNNVKERAL